MSLGTLSEQAAHYRAVRARLWSLPTPVEPAEEYHPVVDAAAEPDHNPEPEPEPEPQPEPPPDLRTVADKILDEVAAKHKLPRVVLLARRRDKNIVAARHEAMWRLSRETTFSLPMMGRKLGGLDHTTVLHGIRKHEERMRTEGAR